MGLDDIQDRRNEQYRPGDRVRVIDGQWRGRSGVVVAVTDDPYGNLVDIRFDGSDKAQPLTGIHLMREVVDP